MRFKLQITATGKDVPDFGLGPGVLATADLDVDCERPTTGYDAYRLLETVRGKVMELADETLSVTATDEDGKVITLRLKEELF